MIKFYTTSLRSKILLGFSVILIIMFFATLWSVYNFSRFNESIKLTMQNNYSSIIAADNMAKSLDELLNAFIVTFNQDFDYGKSLFEKSQAEFYYWYGKARETAYTDQEKTILDSLNTRYTYFIKSIGERIHDRFYNQKSDIAKNNFFIIADEIKKIKDLSFRIMEINHTLLSEALSQTKEITRTATIFILVILFGAIAVSIVFGTKFSNYVVRPLLELHKSVAHITEGNFSERIEIDENSDELNSLADEFNKMSEKLQKYEELNVSKIFFEQKKSELVIESMNEPVLMIDEKFNIILANKSFNEAFGDKLNQLNFKNILAGKKLDSLYLNEEFSDAHLKEDIITIRNSDGSTKYFKLIAASLEIPESDLKGFVIVFNDITKYRELDRMKSEFIAKVSHELKTPLTSMGMALGIMEEGVVGKLTERQTELISSMKEDYERLNKLVYEILELTKLEASRERIRFEKIKTRKLAEHINKKFLIQAGEKNIRLDIIDNSGEAEINGSIDHVLSAVENLVANSLRFTPYGGEITYRQEVRSKELIIEISDTGIGISPDNLKKIFDKFIQIDDSSPGSLGLGLSIAKEIIEIHNGEIKAFSDLGKGSTFQINLPAA
ncbi:MAG: HAMP domain-containing protein [Ignavibacteriales bacterium]|nr:HAMP domain-containing protein [Ignavibacteriales bacterium]